MTRSVSMVTAARRSSGATRAAEAGKLKAGDDAAARKFFEDEFAPFVAAGKTGPNGKLTGYYVQEIHASRKKAGKFQIPILARPSDLVMLDLGKFCCTTATAATSGAGSTRASSSRFTRAPRSGRARSRARSSS